MQRAACGQPTQCAKYRRDICLDLAQFWLRNTTAQELGGEIVDCRCLGYLKQAACVPPSRTAQETTVKATRLSLWKQNSEPVLTQRKRKLHLIKDLCLTERLPTPSLPLDKMP